MVDVKNVIWDTALNWAAREGHTSVVNILIEPGPCIL